MEIFCARGSFDECVYGDRVLYQFDHWQQLHDDQWQASHGQYSGSIATLADLHRLHGSAWNCHLPSALYSIYHKGLACKSQRQTRFRAVVKNQKIKVEFKPVGAMAESADATDLKSVGGDTVRVRPPLAPLIMSLHLSAMTYLSERE